MYAKSSSGLQLNYSPDLELRLNKRLLYVFIQNIITLYAALDVHKQSDTDAMKKQSPWDQHIVLVVAENFIHGLDAIMNRELWKNEW